MSTESYKNKKAVLLNLNPYSIENNKQNDCVKQGDRPICAPCQKVHANNCH